jgi:hypothetical protein
MALTGKAFLAIWHDIDPPSWTEYMEWHTREHMPERLSIPGFTIGKRLINHSVPRYRYGTVYGGETVEVFRSPAYLERLNNPTDWSNKVQPTFRNFLRMACDRIASAGVGEGGAMATIRLDFSDGAGPDTVRSSAQTLADALLEVTGACGVHIGLARTEVSGVKTKETELRPGMAEKEFDVVVLVEGSGAPELEASIPELQAVIAASDIGVTNPQTIVYNLAYQLTSADMAGAGAAQ